MVLLTMTPSIVEALSVESPNQQARSDNTVPLPPTSEDEPSLLNPEIGNPISHSQTVALRRKLKSQSDSAPSLEQLLRGAHIYIPPPPPKREPTREYKALMARLRRDEEARSYERMLNPHSGPDAFHDRFPSAAHAYAEANKPTSREDIGDDDVSFSQAHREVTLIVNFMASILGVAGTLWVAARWWSTSSRLFLTLGGSILVAIAEVVVYNAYMWRMGEARKKQGMVGEVKEVMETWVVGQEEDRTDAKDEKTVLIKEKDETPDAPPAQAGTESRSRTRGKVLRTYGKRAAATEARSEPPLKKQRTSEEELQPEDSTPKAESAPVPETNPATGDDTAARPKTEVKKGSILSFFKPVSQPPPVTSSPQVDEMESKSNPAASPPACLATSPPATSRIETKRKPRILKFRGSSLPGIDTEAVDGNQAESEPDDQEDSQDEEPTQCRKYPRPRLQLRQLSPANEVQEEEKLKKPKAKPSPTVQTTLNISSRAAFSECKVCNTVWNPLHPEDVKFHKKQHAAIIRAKKKLKESEL
ncbi:hypothetical protein AK830_g6264 [Neonectria ditissima]|uniref:N-acetyltransferase ESCO zinc-finger domain-containing protein n=1 Tax=Neonectria ditissima TaxID=78410 RepID=A0A0N8H6Y4_9HYPO|nr:hypothetical protein AK830_g6264 [Neonectria ditissima]